MTPAPEVVPGGAGARLGPRSTSLNLSAHLFDSRPAAHPNSASRPLSDRNLPLRSGRATVVGVALETAASSPRRRLTQARIGDTLHDGNGTRVAVVNAFTTESGYLRQCPPRATEESSWQRQKVGGGLN